MIGLMRQMLWHAQVLFIKMCTYFNNFASVHFVFLQGYIEKGLFSITYGAADNLVEFLHVDNLVQAHIKAAQALTQHKHYIAVSITHQGPNTA